MDDNTPESWFERMSARLGTVVAAVALVSFVGMLISTWSQVLFRHLELSVDWAEELARMLLLVSVFFGIAIAIREKKHIVIDFLINRLPGRGAIVLRLVFDALILIFLAFLLRGAVTMVEVTWESYMISLNWMRTGQIYLAECVAIAVMMVYVLADVLAGIRQLKGPGQ
jgi:TRAP-type C4-dicarboxylate transport system permease small subunit